MSVGPRRAAFSARRRILVILAGIVGVLAIVMAVASTLYTEVLWFQEVGYTKVFWTGIWVRLGLGAIFGVVFAVVLLVNLWIVRRITSPARLFSVSDQVLERYRASLQPYTKWIVIGGSALFGLFAGSSASVQWRSWLLFRHSTDFGTIDPVFKQDIGFYVFRLPFHQFLFTWAFSTLIVATLVVAGAHYFMGGIRPQVDRDRVAPEVRAHLSVLLGLVVLLKAWGYRLDQYDLLYSSRGNVTGASYTDVNAQLPALKLLVVIAVICSVFFFINARVKNWILPVAGIALLWLTSILAGGVYPAIVQRLRVAPNERIRERPYIERNLTNTRAAYAIDHVEQRQFPPPADLTTAEIERHRPTIENIRLWDPGVLVDQYLALQRIKQYYEFLDVDVDRYRFAGQRRQVMISAREVDLSQQSGSTQTWLNSHLVYTHGYGLVASRVDRVLGDGQPDFVLKNIPAQASQGMPPLTQAQVYFGEIEHPEFVVVNSEQKELDFPEGATVESFAETQYDGAGGVEMGGFLRRAALAWRFRDINLMISGAIRSDSKILYHRNIRDRALRLAPFLQFDTDPYVTIVDGRPVWILDGYTTTDMYPYSERVQFGARSNFAVNGLGNYIRNAAKFVVDAKDGTVTGYVWDEDDPILKAWMSVFPGLLHPKSEMPPGILEHVRYPEGLYRIQTDRYATYHIESPDNFYSKEDVWDVARDPTKKVAAGSPVPFVPPYYVLQELPGETGLDFVLGRPFTPIGRQNMSAFMVAHSDPENYGALVSYVFPKSEAILGPQQVQGKINQDPVISPQITLLNSGGSDVIYGNILIVPIDDALLYVQPLYVVGAGSKIPELKRVVVLTGGRVKMATTLPEALQLLFKDLPADLGGGGPSRAESIADLVRSALVHFEKADAALRAGNFAEYGRQQRLGRRDLDEAARKSGATKPSPGASGSPTPTATPSG